MTIVGNGSNILVKDNGIRGIVVKLEFDKIEIDKKEDIAIVNCRIWRKTKLPFTRVIKKRYYRF